MFMLIFYRGETIVKSRYMYLKSTLIRIRSQHTERLPSNQKKERQHFNSITILIFFNKIQELIDIKKKVYVVQLLVNLVNQVYKTYSTKIMHITFYHLLWHFNLITYFDINNLIIYNLTCNRHIINVSLLFNNNVSFQPICTYDAVQLSKYCVSPVL